VGVRLIGPPEADGEYIGIPSGAGGEEIVHLHDYERIYAVPGLYERIVQGLLQCMSPRFVAATLARTLERRGLDPAQIRLLDLGAGTGLVGELVAEHGVTDVIGIDPLESARDACARDRPGLYRDYLVADLAHPSERLVAEVKALCPNALTAAGAFGGTHAPAEVLRVALELLPSRAPVVFTIDRNWTSSDGSGGFKTPLAELISSHALNLLERSRFQHRLSTSGEPIIYELFSGLTG
jgi:SAM-dependent methyltransferase